MSREEEGPPVLEIQADGREDRDGQDIQPGQGGQQVRLEEEGPPNLDVQVDGHDGRDGRDVQQGQEGGGDAPAPANIDELLDSSNDVNDVVVASDSSDSSDEYDMDSDDEGGQNALRHAEVPDLLPYPLPDPRCINLWYAVRRRLWGLIRAGDQFLWRRTSHGNCSEEVVAIVRRNYELCHLMFATLPTVARSFHSNMDDLALVDRLVSEQQGVLREALEREPWGGVDYSDED
jgi:hypothetical protein